MDQAVHNKLVSFIWNIADDVLRDVFVRGKYRDVILPMCVLRRLDAVLEPTKQAVLDTKKMLDDAGITEQREALCGASGQAFYNTSRFCLRDLRARSSQQQLLQDFEDYLNGFSSNVQDILINFELRNSLPKLSKSDALGTLIEKFLDPEINLSPNPVVESDGTVRHPALDNHSMGTVFEELVRKFNEENNEEAGEHWTPRDAVKLMANLVLLPIADSIQSGSYLLYDGACGTGGMLTVAEETLIDLARRHGREVRTHLYGQEINGETYAICKADMLLKGEGEHAEHIVGGPEWSTLSHDAFPAREFDFMLSNPPYGKSWKKDLEVMGGKDGMRDPRFKLTHDGDAEYSLVTRSSDGQMLFLANMASKMNHATPLGSRIAEVHNGSSLFTGDAGQGESNIRRWIIENDWLDTIVALPLNLFYNTGIATYIWVLTNRKPDHRRGMVQLIDATQWFKPLRKNLGKKNCELSADDIETICKVYQDFAPTKESKVFPNAAFGYWKVTVERPLRLHSQLTLKAIETLRFASGDEELRSVLYDEFGDALHTDFGSVEAKLAARLSEWGRDENGDSEDEGTPKRTLPEKKKRKLLDAKTWERDGRLVETAKVGHQRGRVDLTIRRSARPKFNVGRKPKQLTLLQTLLLTFVKRGLTSSYDLIRQAGMSVGITNPALKQLRQDGLLNIRTGPRNRVDYSLTKKGEEALRNSLDAGKDDFWRQRGLQSNYDSILRAALLLWFCFGSEEAMRCVQYGVSELRMNAQRARDDGDDTLREIEEVPMAERKELSLETALWWNKTCIDAELLEAQAGALSELNNRLACLAELLPRRYSPKVPKAS